MLQDSSDPQESGAIAKETAVWNMHPKYTGTPPPPP